MNQALQITARIFAGDRLPLGKVRTNAITHAL
jgi:hypothetical protein